MRDGGKGGRGKGEEVGAPRTGHLLFPLSLSLFLLPSLLLSGCGKAPRTDHGRKPPKKESFPLKSLHVGAGDTLVYQSADPKSLPSFSLRWTGGGFDALKGNVDTGHLQEPQGEIYSNGKPASTYRADDGDATRATKRLGMKGNVVLRTIDRKSTLHASAGEYRGDVKLVRATGGVTASGTFGTLSGVPELWATPDLRLIGTPDMVSKQLKLPALLALAATAAVATPVLQKSGEYKLENYTSPSLENLNPGYRFTARPRPGKGPIVLTIPSRGMTIRSAGAIVVVFDGSEVRRVTSEGAVNVVQRSAGGTTTMDGDGSVYVAEKGAATGTVDLGGPVVLVNATTGPKGPQSTTSRGRKGHAVLKSKPGANEDALQSATLDGDVRIATKGAGDDVFEGTGDRLVYVPKGDLAEADLTGGVVLTQKGQAKDDAGAVVSRTVVSRGERAHAVLSPGSGADANPLRNATLTGGVTIDVTGSNAQSFKGKGDKVVYTAVGEGGRAVMTGDLKFSGDVPSFLADVADTDTAVVTIGKSGWQRVDLDNSGGGPTTTTIKTRPKPPTEGKGQKGKGKKGGKP